MSEPTGTPNMSNDQPGNIFADEGLGLKPHGPGSEAQPTSAPKADEQAPVHPEEGGSLLDDDAL